MAITRALENVQKTSPHGNKKRVGERQLLKKKSHNSIEKVADVER